MSLVGTFDVGGAAGPAVRHSLYLGGKEDAKSLDKLQARKIKYILNVTPKKSDLQAGVSNYFEKKPQHGLVYLRVPIYDSVTSIPQLEVDYKDQIVNFITKGLYHGNVLVHCHHGISRSTTCVALYLMRKRDMILEEAMAMIRRRRPQAQPIPAFMEFLQVQDDFLKTEREKRNKKRGRRGADGKSDSDDDERKKASRVVGPSLGPAPRPNDDGEKKAAGPAVGPALPPNFQLQDRRKEGEKEHAQEKSSAKITAPFTSFIGPSPPNSKE